MKARKASEASETDEEKRRGLIAALGMEIVRFQDASNAVDDAASAVLALGRVDLQFVSILLFAGPQPTARLAGMLHLAPAAFRGVMERVELAGYVRRERSASGEVVTLTEHARTWIETIWGPLERAGARLLASETTAHLELFLRFLQAIRPTHEEHAARIRALAEVPGPKRRSSRARGGLSPAALRRVQLYVEANLGGDVHLASLAERAGLSVFHFARAFRATTGTTPRAYVEEQRVARARQLIEESDLSLAEIAVATGLGTQSRLTTIFRRATGLTPAVVRRQRR